MTWKMAVMLALVIGMLGVTISAVRAVSIMQAEHDAYVECMEKANQVAWRFRDIEAAMADKLAKENVELRKHIYQSEGADTLARLVSN